MKNKLLLGALLIALAAGAASTVVCPPSFMQTQKSYR
jgi:hypothetical protein